MTPENNIRLVQPLGHDSRGRPIFSHLPDGRIGVEYEFQIVVEPAGCTFTATELPDGLEISPDGLIHGCPTVGGFTYVPVVKATYPDGNTEKWPIHVHIANEDDVGDHR